LTHCPRSPEDTSCHRLLSPPVSPGTSTSSGSTSRRSVYSRPFFRSLRLRTATRCFERSSMASITLETSFFAYVLLIPGSRRRIQCLRSLALTYSSIPLQPVSQGLSPTLESTRAFQSFAANRVGKERVLARRFSSFIRASC